MKSQLTEKTNAQKALQQVTQAPVDEHLRVTRRIEIGHCVQQGDVYIFRVPDDHPHGEPVGVGLVQIALGTGNGARHMAEGKVKVYAGVKLPDGVTAPEGIDPKEMLGPVVIGEDTWRVPHPEHPHHQLPEGTYQVVYQCDLRTMRRVVD